MSQRQLVRQRADGTLYAVPYTPRAPLPYAGRYRAAEPRPQPADGPLNGAQPSRMRRGWGKRALTDDDVREIRADYAAGKWIMKDLAYIYDVSQSTIYAAIHGYTWVPEED